MKRSIDLTEVNNLTKDLSEPSSKVVLVETEIKPCGVPLVNHLRVSKKSYNDLMELEEGVSNVTSAIHANAQNKLEIIGRQMKNLQHLMVDVLQETKLNSDLHSAACNFVKKPGNTYHLYEKPSGQKYFGMLSPEEWQNPPHAYLGSFFLEADLSWTPANSRNERNEGINFLRQMLGPSQVPALT